MSPHTKHVLIVIVQTWIGLGLLILVLWLIFVGQFSNESERQARRLRERREEAERARRLQRQRKLLAQADFIESVPEHERQRLQREAEAMGFLDDDDQPRTAA
jgi:cell division protein FtsI/penicillin-binding protein 2